MKKITLVLLSLLGFAFAQTGTAGVQIIHNAADPAAATVDIYVNGGLAIDDLDFRTATSFLPLPAGVNLSVDVAPGNSTNVSQSLANFNLGSLTANTNYVVMANGVLDPTQFDQSVNSNIGFDLKILAPFDTFANALNQVSYRTYHGVTDAPAIDLFNGPWKQVGPLSYGNYFFRDQTVPALNYTLDVRVAGNGPVVTTLDADLRGLENQVPVIFASGFLNPANNQNGDAIGFFAALSNGDVVPINMTNPVASVQIVHNAPDPAAALVDIYVNGNLALEDFAFRTATPFIPLPANTPLNIGVAPANGPIIATIPAGSLAAGERYIIMATGVLDPSAFDQTANGSAIGFGLEVFAPAQDGSGSANTAILAYHGAPDAPAVDVRTGGANLVPNISYTDYAGYLQVPAANYVLEVAPAGGNPIAAFQADLSGRAGKAGLVFASGFLNPAANQNGPAFGLFYVTGGGTVIALPPVNANPPMMAKVQVIHNAPDPAANTVDIYINGARALNDFTFRSATPFIDLHAGQVINIGVAGGNSSSAADTLVNFQVGPLMAGKAYVVMASGVLDPSNFDQSANGSDIAFDLKILADARTESANGMQVDYMAFHGAPDAPAVDVFNGPWIQLGPLSYGNYFSRYQVQPALRYKLDIKVAGTNTIATTIDADLRGLEGMAPIVFASGFLNPAANQNGPAFGFYAVLADGTVAPLPAIPSHMRTGLAGDQGFTVSPNPAVSRIVVELDDALSSEAQQINLVDMQGRVLRTKLTNGNLSYGMDLSGISAGLYMVQIKTADRAINHKVTVQ